MFVSIETSSLKHILKLKKNHKDQLKLKSNSNWTADKLLSRVDTFITGVGHDMKNSLLTPILKDNTSKSEREGLKTYNRKMTLS